MNAYVAEIIAAERAAEFEREAARARLIREVRRGAADRPAQWVRGPRLVATATFAVMLWLAVAR
jgi:hypothetical protein